ncbi:hypothetical protein SteCoe_35675 [Stentor coeruleus]|uniref:Uncharacterized protein n=1 Tax=Stentor coeruleus TaxID=5963 RepID=A0A1R2AS21_9CILI|nr:hypothetical protein SteCoe_35675 [Stentor coeruleus]
MASARAVLPLPEYFLPYDYCILVLGGTGCGKSTFVNTFINVVLNRDPENLIIAVESKPYPNVHEDFIIESEGEDINSKLSHTKAVHYYKLSSEITNNKTILLVDTPGLGAAEGIKMDDSFIDKIIDAARTIPRINAIIVIEKSTTNRQTALVEYCLYRISEVIPNDFERKVILGITFHTGPSDFDKSWFMFNVQMTAKLNNLCFSYTENDYKSKPKKLENSLKEWDKSKRKITRIIGKVFEMEAQETTIYTKLFTKHNEAMKAISDMTVILENIDSVVGSIINSSRNIESANVIKWERTLSHNTICVRHNTLCHENCFLNFTGVKNAEYFKNCACMHKNCNCPDPNFCECKFLDKKCKICNCGSDQHVHRHEKPVNKRQALESFLKDLSISGSKCDQKSILKELDNKRKDIYEKLYEYETQMLEISKNYKLSRYFGLALKHLELKVESANPGIQNNEIGEQIKLYKELSKCEEVKSRNKL